MKRRIRLTESDLHRIVEESVKRIINEADFDRQEFANQMAAGVLDVNMVNGHRNGSLNRVYDDELYANNIPKPTHDKYWVRNNYLSDPMVFGKIPSEEKDRRIKAYDSRERHNSAGVKLQDAHPEIKQKQMERERNAFTNLDPLEVRRRAYELAYSDVPRGELYRKTRRYLKK